MGTAFLYEMEYLAEVVLARERLKGFPWGKLPQCAHWG